MKKVIMLLAISLLTSSCLTSCRKDDLLNIKEDVQTSLDPTKPIQVFIFNGESGSVGIAPNDSATSLELQPQGSLQIWNNDSSKFQNLQIGVNNELGDIVLGAIGSNTSTYHGWELELCNLYKSISPNRNAFLIKTGQCGTSISQWDTLGYYNNMGVNFNPYLLMKSRIQNALSQLRATGRPLQIFVLYDQGINDNLYTHLAGNVWEQKTRDHLNRVKSIIGQDVTFILTKHTADNGNDLYNSNIENLALSDSTGRTHFVEAATGLTMPDGNHYGYTGMKVITQRMFSIIQTEIHN